MASFKVPELGEDFSITGHWWLTSRPAEPIAGTLSSTGGRMHLRLLGSLPGIDPNRTYIKVPLIHGVAEAKSVSLVDRFQTHFALKMPGTIEQGFMPGLTYLGDHLPDSGAHEFESWGSVLTDLGPWIGEEPVHQSFQMGEGGKLSRISHVYEGGSEHRFRVDTESVNLRFGYDISTEGDAYQSRAFKYAARLTIEPDAPKDAAWFMNRVQSVNELMSLLVGRLMRSRHVYALRQSGSEKTESYEVRFDHRPPARTKKLQPYEILVPRMAVSDMLGRIASTWFVDHDKLQEPVSLILYAVHEGPLEWHVRLLLLCQALESFHRNFCGGYYLSEEAYEPIKSALTKAIPEDTESSLKDSLRSRIRFGNQYSLLKRLNELHKALGDPLLRRIAVDADTFARDVKDARNYYTHWDSASVVDIPKGAALANLVSKLSAVARLVLLKHLGVDIDIVVTNMLNNRALYLEEYQPLV